jgi:hypothetical protein
LVYTNQVTVKLAFKSGAILMMALIAAGPLMACMLPGSQMSQAEMECCKTMAHCGDMNMSAEHDCCKTIVQPNQIPLASNHFVLVNDASYLGLPVSNLLVANGGQHVTGATSESGHSPPGPDPASSQVLRI